MIGKKGFTLIELMTAVAIIGILMSFAFTSFQQSRRSARDSKRKADLEMIRAALEMYKADKGCYPCGNRSDCPTSCKQPFGSGSNGQGWATNDQTTGSCVSYPATLENILENNGYLASVPVDPLGGGCQGLIGSIYYGYMYYFNTGANISGQNYCLYARLENAPTTAETNAMCSGCIQSPITNYHKNYCVKNP